MAKPRISPALAAELLDYDPETGFLTWRKRRRDLFSANRSHARWNNRFAGTRAFTFVNDKGYYCGTILEHPYKAHRVIWAIVYGEWPRGQIDHIDGCRLNNCISNLRVVTNAENLRNAGISAANTSGITGVSWDKKRGKWHAFIRANTKNIHLGYYNNIDDAATARRRANELYGFHPNHGERPSAQWGGYGYE